VLTGVTVSDAQRAAATALKSGERRAVWLGALALRSADLATIRLLARELARATGACFGELAEGSNAAGAYLAGAVPHRAAAGVMRASNGLDARQMLEKPLSAYMLLNAEPWADSLQPDAQQALQQAKLVVAITPYATEQMRRIAHVMLPAGTFAETSGTYVNLEGRWQSFAGAATPLGQSRPAWKILRVLGNMMGLSGFDYQSSEQVRDELKAAIDSTPSLGFDGGFMPAPAAALAHAEPIPDVPMYQIDPLVRRAPSLQRTRDGREAAAHYGGS
jgi:NADH-quinone oxidoreductase subunit G